MGFFDWFDPGNQTPQQTYDELYDELVRLANLRPAPGPGRQACPEPTLIRMCICTVGL